MNLSVVPLKKKKVCLKAGDLFYFNNSDDYLTGENPCIRLEQKVGEFLFGLHWRGIFIHDDDIIIMDIKTLEVYKISDKNPDFVILKPTNNGQIFEPKN